MQTDRRRPVAHRAVVKEVGGILTRADTLQISPDCSYTTEQRNKYSHLLARTVGVPSAAQNIGHADSHSKPHTRAFLTTTSGLYRSQNDTQHQLRNKLHTVRSRIQKVTCMSEYFEVTAVYDDLKLRVCTWNAMNIASQHTRTSGNA
jgi:hypothetical protein